MSSTTRFQVLAAAALTLGVTAFAQVGTAFTYQARLANDGQPVNGTADIRFTLFSAQSGGSQIGSPVTVTGVAVTDGLFSTSVDFGTGPYTTDQALWVQIEVRSPSGGGAFTLLSGRQPLSPAPFSLATRGLSVAANGDTLLRTETGGIRTFGLAQGNQLSTSLVIQAGGTTASNGAAQNGGQLTLRAGNANLSAASGPPIGTSANNDVVIQAGENTFNGAFGDRFPGNIRFIAGDSGIPQIGNQPERMRIVGDNGFVGIGTISPACLFDVNSGVRIAGPIQNSTTRITSTADLGLYSSSGWMRFATNSAPFRFFTNYANGTAGSPTAAQVSIETDGSLVAGTGTVELRPAGNGSNDAFAGFRRSNGQFGALVAGFNGGVRYGLGVVNNAGSTAIGVLYVDHSTDQAHLVAAVKNFVEPNPRDASTDIYYASLEGPEAAMYIRGTGLLEGGRAVISLPAHFSDLASSQGITVQVTPLTADSLGLAVVAKSTTGFEVRELMRGTSTYEFDWEVKAVRMQHLDYEVVRPWTERRVNNPDISDEQAWQLRQEAVARSNAHAAALEAAARARALGQ